MVPLFKGLAPILALSLLPAHGLAEELDIDLDGLNTRVIEPEIEDIKVKFEELKASLNLDTLGTEQKAKLSKLEESLTTQTIEPTLEIFESNGPMKWKAAAIAHTEAEYELDVIASRVDEEWQASEYCGFDDYGVTDHEAPKFTWQSIKKAGKPRSKSLGYFLNMTVPVYGILADSNEKGAWCDYPTMKFLFSRHSTKNKIIDLTEHL